MTSVASATKPAAFGRPEDALGALQTPLRILAKPEARCEDAARRQDLRAANRRRYRREVLQAAPEGVILGGVIGALGMNPLSALAGAWVGAEMSTAKVRGQRRGRVAIRLDGEQRVEPYRWSPEGVSLTADEHEALRVAWGHGGDAIHLAPPTADSGPIDLAPERLARLAELEAERRLVADCGGTTGHGRPAVQLVSALNAARIIREGGAVFAVDTRNHQRRSRQLEVRADNRSLSDPRHVYEAIEWTEHRFDYTLTPITEHASWVSGGRGLPEGALGVARDATTQRIVTDTQAFSSTLAIENRRRSNRHRQHYDESRASLTGPTAPEDRSFRIQSKLPLREPAAMLGALGALLLTQQLLPYGDPHHLLAAVASARAAFVAAGQWMLRDRV